MQRRLLLLLLSSVFGSDEQHKTCFGTRIVYDALWPNSTRRRSTFSRAPLEVDTCGFCSCTVECRQITDLTLTTVRQTFATEWRPGAVGRHVRQLVDLLESAIVEFALDILIEIAKMMAAFARQHITLLMWNSCWNLNERRALSCVKVT